MTDPRQRAHRNLKELELYSTAKETLDRAPEPVKGEGKIIGVYNADSSDHEATIWICEKGIWTTESEPTWQLIPYAEMRRTTYPAEKTETTVHLGLEMRDGSHRLLLVVGGKGHVRDLYSIGTFLQRCLEDAQRERNPDLAALDGNSQ